MWTSIVVDVIYTNNIADVSWANNSYVYTSPLRIIFYFLANGDQIQQISNILPCWSV